MPIYTPPPLTQVNFDLVWYYRPPLLSVEWQVDASGDTYTGDLQEYVSSSEIQTSNAAFNPHAFETHVFYDNVSVAAVFDLVGGMSEAVGISDAASGRKNLYKVPPKKLSLMKPHPYAMIRLPEKSAAETSDYTVDLSSLVEDISPDQIFSLSWNVPDTFTVNSTSFNNNVATIWLSGGVSGRDNEISLIVTTDGGRVIEYKFRLLVRDE